MSREFSDDRSDRNKQPEPSRRPDWNDDRRRRDESGAGNDITLRHGGNNDLTTKDSGGAHRNMVDVANHSLDRAHGGGGEVQHVGDTIYKPPTEQFAHAARETTARANWAEGRPTVTNMTFRTGDGEISGPVSYTKSGQQFVIDESTHQRYRVLPPSADSPHGAIQPVHRGGVESEPRPLMGQRVTSDHRPETVHGPGEGGGRRFDGGDGGRSEYRPGGRTNYDPGATGRGPGDGGHDGGRGGGHEGGHDGGRGGAEGDGGRGEHRQGGRTDFSPADTGRGSEHPGRGPVEVHGPVEGGRGPAEGGRGRGDGGHGDGGRGPVEVGRGPVEVGRGPEHGGRGPVEVGRGPVEVGRGPVEGGRGPTEGGRGPGDHGHGDAGRAPNDPTRGPHDPTRIPIDAPVGVGGLGRGPGGPHPGDGAHPGHDGKGNGPEGQLGRNPDGSFAPPTRDAATRAMFDQLTRLQQQYAQGKGMDGAPQPPIGRTALEILASMDLKGGPGKINMDRLDVSQQKPMLVELFHNLEMGRLPADITARQAKLLQDFTKSMGPEGMSQLRVLLGDLPAGTMRSDVRFDTNVQSKLRELMDALRPPSTERFAELVRSNERLTTQTRMPDADSTRNSATELVRTLRDYNATVGLDTARALTFKDIISKDLGEPRTDVPVEQKTFMLNPQDQSLVRTLQQLGQRADTDVDRSVRGDLLTGAQPLKPVETPTQFTVGQAIALNETGGHIVGPKSEVIKPDEKTTDKPQDQTKKIDKEEPIEELDAAQIAALAARKGELNPVKTQQELIAEKDKKEPERRQKYMVKEGDTLESIAQRFFRDKALASLIYEINRSVVGVRMVNGKKMAELQPKTTIWLPTSTDVRDYRLKPQSAKVSDIEFGGAKFASVEAELAARFGANWDKGANATNAQTDSLEDMEESARVAYQNRRSNIESLLGPMLVRPSGDTAKYVVRLGDTLKSIAIKHPALNDVVLWRLLAEVNNLSTATDDKGNPQAAIKRGQTLMLPSVEQIDAFRTTGTDRAQPKTTPTRTRAVSDRPTTGTRRISATGKPGSEVLPTRPYDSHFDKDTGQPAATGDRKPAPSQDQNDDADYAIVAQMSDSCRLLQAGNPEQLELGFKLKLELKQSERWLTLASYEIYDDVSLRHEYSSQGVRKTIRIDLPPQHALELAQNDMTNNWESYCSDYNKKKPGL